LGTPLQDVYDSFLAKVTDEDFTYKSDLIFQYFKFANGSSYKTVPENLNYTLNVDSIVFYIDNKANINGNITFTIDSKLYVVAVLATDSLINIADKVVDAIKSDFTIIKNYTNDYPIITIEKDNSDLSNTVYIDTDNTGVQININKTYDGYYDDELGQDTINLISLYMAYNYYLDIVLKKGKQKSYFGSKDFNKFPNIKSQYENAEAALNILDDKIEKSRQEFYNYKN